MLNVKINHALINIYNNHSFFEYIHKKFKSQLEKTYNY